jgi:hypothetical protein
MKNLIAAVAGPPAGRHFVGRRILQDMPVRNPLLEAYAAKK